MKLLDTDYCGAFVDQLNVGEADLQNLEPLEEADLESQQKQFVRQVHEYSSNVVEDLLQYPTIIY